MICCKTQLILIEFVAKQLLIRKTLVILRFIELKCSVLLVIHIYLQLLLSKLSTRTMQFFCSTLVHYCYFMLLSLFTRQLCSSSIPIWIQPWCQLERKSNHPRKLWRLLPLPKIVIRIVHRELLRRWQRRWMFQHERQMQHWIEVERVYSAW